MHFNLFKILAGTCAAFISCSIFAANRIDCPNPLKNEIHFSGNTTWGESNQKNIFTFLNGELPIQHPDFLSLRLSTAHANTQLNCRYTYLEQDRSKNFILAMQTHLNFIRISHAQCSINNSDECYFFPKHF